MRYCYRCDNGHPFEVEKPIACVRVPETCPECGSGTTERDYQAECVTGATAALHNDIKKYPYVSNRLPRDLDGCQTDPKGKPVIVSKSHEREIMARYGYRRD